MCAHILDALEPFRVGLHLTQAYPARTAGKLAGLDKKLSRSLEQDVQEGGSPIELSMSPVGPLTDSSR
jgi:hypothetical protein